MKTQSGQVAIEYVLMTIVIVSVAVLMARGIRSNEILSKMVNGPWEILSGMVENGVWATPQASRESNPNYLRRHVTFKGDN